MLMYYLLLKEATLLRCHHSLSQRAELESESESSKVTENGSSKISNNDSSKASESEYSKVNSDDDSTSADTESASEL